VAEAATASRRIVHIAKELNISHHDIIELLDKNGIEVKSHMSPVNEQTYQLIVEEFEKDLQSVSRYRKEKVRKEIHFRKLEERLHPAGEFEIMMPDEQRKLEEEEKKAVEEQVLAEDEAELDVVESADEAERDVSSDGKPETEVTEEEPAPRKKTKFRKVELADIQAKIDSGRRRPPVKPVKKTEEDKEKKDGQPVSVSTTVRQTLARMDTKTKKKKYKRDRVEDGEESEVEYVPAVKVKEFMSVQEVAGILDLSPAEIITKCLELGVPATINQRLDIDTITLLVEDAGYQVEMVEEETDDILSLQISEEELEGAVPRAPVVTIMGHVDHGKTSLLDYIRSENVVAGEAGGITQHIGAYAVNLEDGRAVTFLDTPGHEAFTAMRSRGAQVTDVVILIVAADDGVKPQTVEAINHAKAADVPIVVAINKIDKSSANPDRVKQELSENGVLVEDWGGKIQCIPLSAKSGEGVDELLDLLALETEVLELKANPEVDPMGIVIESRLDRAHGAIGTVLIQKGTLKVGDVFVCGNSYGKVRALMNERNTRIDFAGPATPVQVLGFHTPPQAGDRLAVVYDEKVAKKHASERDRMQREIDRQKIRTMSLDRLSKEIREGVAKTLPLVVKADVDGSIEALVDALAEIPSDEIKVDIVHQGVGTVSESDVLLATASNAIIVGFNVGVHSNATLLANNSGVDIRKYDVIYEATDEIRLAVEGMLEPDIVEKVLGTAEVRQVFKISRKGSIAGCIITDGVVSRNDLARIKRDDEIITVGQITSLKHFQDDVKSVDSGKECGIGIRGMDSFEEGDLIEVYATEEVKRTLK
jgi:translation initiation factor IF-2|tara:strand:+ start:4171 stop:6627 length:2457 start_codon:yes stop_codon:yes gene_type:complete